VRWHGWRRLRTATRRRGWWLLRGAGTRRRGWRLRGAVGAVVLLAALRYLLDVAEQQVLAAAGAAVAGDPLGLALALCCYAGAFGLRAQAWSAVLPGLPFGQSWAALHVALLGNHVLPLRLGEALRVTSVLRRTGLPAGATLTSAVTLRLGDLLAVVVLALAASAVLLPDLPAGIAAWAWAASGALAAGTAAAGLWLRRLSRTGVGVRMPPPWVAATAVLAWALESAVVWQLARAAGLELSVPAAVAVTAVTIVAQAVAVTPGGFGTYEAAATATLVALGADAPTALAVALATHAVKTAYSLVVGGVALLAPAPSYWGHLRLPRATPPRPPAWPVAADAPVVAVIPAYDEEASVAGVVARLPPTVRGRRVVALVVDDGSRDATAARAAGAGAVVVRQPGNLGLGAAVRRGLAEASALSPAAVGYLDADGEYFPEDLESVLAPVLDGCADYVVGSRFAGNIRRMLPQRRLGNRVLTWWVRWLARRPDVTDGQSGFRAFSPRAAADAEVVHDYNYAQVLTLDLLAKGFAYREVPITYAFRETGTSFVRLGGYLRRVVPAVHRELNRTATTTPSP